MFQRKSSRGGNPPLSHTLSRTLDKGSSATLRKLGAVLFGGSCAPSGAVHSDRSRSCAWCCCTGTCLAECVPLILFVCIIPCSKVQIVPMSFFVRPTGSCSSFSFSFFLGTDILRFQISKIAPFVSISFWMGTYAGMTADVCARAKRSARITYSTGCTTQNKALEWGRYIWTSLFFCSPSRRHFFMHNILGNEGLMG